MEWQAIDAQSLATIDQQIGRHQLSPAEYEIVRRAIYETGDFEYKSAIYFSERSLQAGAAAIAARSPIIADVPMVQVGIIPYLQQTFINPVYCSLTACPARGQIEKPRAALGIQTLAHRYPEGIFAVGKDQEALAVLAKLIKAEEIRPALVICTPPAFVGVEEARTQLRESLIPHIRTRGRKGGAIVTVAIVIGLVELAWHAYRQSELALPN